MRRAAAIAATAALALVPVACGSSSGPTKESFAKQFAAQQVQLRLLGADVGSAVADARRKDDAALSVEFRALADRATGLAGALGALSAPKQYRNDLSTLQSSVTQVAGTLRAIQAAATAHDATAARAGGEAIVADAAQVKTYTEVLTGKLGLRGR
jgi:hypothetical protein